MTSYTYDVRGRAIVVQNPQSPHTLGKYDARGRVIASGMYNSTSGLTASSDPTSVTTNRLELSETFYDARGQVWKTIRHKIDVTDAPAMIPSKTSLGMTRSGE